MPTAIDQATILTMSTTWRSSSTTTMPRWTGSLLRRRDASCLMAGTERGSPSPTPEVKSFIIRQQMTANNSFNEIVKCTTTNSIRYKVVVAIVDRGRPPEAAAPAAEEEPGSFVRVLLLEETMKLVFTKSSNLQKNTLP